MHRLLTDCYSPTSNLVLASSDHNGYAAKHPYKSTGHSSVFLPKGATQPECCPNKPLKRAIHRLFSPRTSYSCDRPILDTNKTILCENLEVSSGVLSKYTIMIMHRWLQPSATFCRHISFDCQRPTRIEVTRRELASSSKVSHIPLDVRFSDKGPQIGQYIPYRCPRTKW